MKKVYVIVATTHIMTAFPEAGIMIITDYVDVQLRNVSGEAGASGNLLKENLLDLTHHLLHSHPAS